MDKNISYAGRLGKISTLSNRWFNPSRRCLYPIAGERGIGEVMPLCSSPGSIAAAVERVTGWSAIVPVKTAVD